MLTPLYLLYLSVPLFLSYFHWVNLLNHRHCVGTENSYNLFILRSGLVHLSGACAAVTKDDPLEQCGPGGTQQRACGVHREDRRHLQTDDYPGWSRSHPSLHWLQTDWDKNLLWDSTVDELTHCCSTVVGQTHRQNYQQEINSQEESSVYGWPGYPSTCTSTCTCTIIFSTPKTCCAPPFSTRGKSRVPEGPCDQTEMVFPRAGHITVTGELHSPV